MGARPGGQRHLSLASHGLLRGSDRRRFEPGTADQPWQTIQHAANTLTAGETVYIRAGTYHEYVTPQRSGTAGNDIIYAAYPGEAPTLDGTGVTAPPRAPEDLSGLFEISGFNYLRVAGLRIVNANGCTNTAGLLVYASS